jgi:hypothetical protein
MVILVAVVAIVIWGATARDVARRSDLPWTRRVLWIGAALLLPLLAVPVYWLIRPLHPTTSAADGTAQSPSPSVVPGWVLSATTCRELRRRACNVFRDRVPAAFYSWLARTELSRRHPDCLAKLLRCTLAREPGDVFLGCSDVRALIQTLEPLLRDSRDLRAVTEELLRLCPSAA